MAQFLDSDLEQVTLQYLEEGKMLPFFDETQIRAVLRMDDLISAMEQALIEFSSGNVAQPTRQMLNVEPHGGHFGAMPAASAKGMGAKLVTFYPGNAALGLPTHMALIVLFRPETGEPLAILDGRLITEMRTAAVSAAATKAMAPPRRQGARNFGQRRAGSQPCRGTPARA